MLRAFLLSIVALLAAVPALAAGDIDTCRNTGAEATARLAACEGVIADDTITGKSRGAAFWFRGDTLIKKRDHDGAIAAFAAAHDADPDNVFYINARGLAYSNKGDDEHALADYDLCLQMRPNFAPAYNNRGLIFMRRGDLQRAFDEFNIALSLNAPASRYINLFNRGRVQTLRKQFAPALADFAAARQLNPEGWQIPNYRCITYAELGRFDEAIADCNEVLAKHPKWVGPITNRGNAYLGKGDLDAALRDYNEAIGISPNFVRAYVGRGRLFEKRKDFAAARADYRSAGAALTKVDEIEATLARRFAKERLDALVAAEPSIRPPAGGPASSGKAATPASAPRKVALIVGNGAYRNVEKLDNPARDAKLIADTFRGLGFHAVTLAPDLTRDKFFAALRDFGAEAEKADWAVVYYAGHGMEIGGINYLLPTDAKLVADHDAETQAVALEQVIAAVSGARKLRLVMLDACRDNPFEQTMQRTMAVKLVSKGLSNIEPEAGFMVVYAAKHGETALDGDATNSPFAAALARDIREPKVEIRKLFDIVRDDVWKATNHLQQPFTYGSLPGREDFYFVAEK
jgi:tetratricopeptide (TPR) repeat protein